MMTSKEKEKAYKQYAIDHPTPRSHKGKVIPFTTRDWYHFAFLVSDYIKEVDLNYFDDRNFNIAKMKKDLREVVFHTKKEDCPDETKTALRLLKKLK